MGFFGFRTLPVADRKPLLGAEDLCLFPEIQGGRDIETDPTACWPVLREIHQVRVNAVWGSAWERQVRQDEMHSLFNTHNRKSCGEMG